MLITANTLTCYAHDGSVFNRCKGGNYKGCFHVPRALLYSMKVAESVMEQQGDGGSAAAAEGIVRAAGSLSVSPVAPGLSSGVRPASPQGTSSWGIGHGHGNNYDSAAKDGHQVPSPSTAGAAGQFLLLFLHDIIHLSIFSI